MKKTTATPSMANDIWITVGFITLHVLLTLVLIENSWRWAHGERAFFFLLLAGPAGVVALGIICAGAVHSPMPIKRRRTIMILAETLVPLLTFGYVRAIM